MKSCAGHAEQTNGEDWKIQKSRGPVSMDSPDGRMSILPLYNRDWLTLDEIVEIEPFDETLIAQRLVPNDKGSELLVTLFQPERMADHAFREMSDHMHQAMRSLKRMIEMKAPAGARLMPCETLSVTIDRDPGSTFDFVSSVSSLPQWALRLIKSMSRPGGDWSARPRGTARVRLHHEHGTGIADQHIIPEPGADFLVPVRVLPNNAGSEVTVTLFQPKGMPDLVFRDMLSRAARTHPGAVIHKR